MAGDLERRRAIAERLRARRGAIASRATDLFLAHHPDWVERYGELARMRGEEDAAFHADFLAGALLAADPAAYQSYARWTAGVLASRGIAEEFLVENLEQVGEAAAEELDEEGRRLIEPLVAGAVAAVRRRMEAAPEQAMAETFRDERALYLESVLQGARAPALAVALEALRRGERVSDVYRDLLQPVQYEIGRLWERNRITVAEEHMATAVTQYVMAELYTRLEIPSATRGRAIVTGVQGELHQIGANMVADVLQADGWDTRFLGTQLPHGGVLKAIAEHEARLLGISATILFNVPAVADLIAGARRDFGSDLAIIVGGAAFGGPGNGWREIGADGFGRDLRDALVVARELTNRSSS